MNFTLPTILTMMRIALVPVLVLIFYLPFHWSNEACVVVFVLAAVTDWADGYLARRTGQLSRFGEFLDPVADKIMVATALILLVQRQETYQAFFAIAAAVIVGREITISALREWLSDLGERSRVKVSLVGKVKTGFQMTAIGFLLYHDPIWILPISLIGELLLFTAAALTLWSMWHYLESAWPVISDSRHHGPYPGQGRSSDADIVADADSLDDRAVGRSAGATMGSTPESGVDGKAHLSDRTP